ncbi:sensor histidine kinase [Alkalihalobacterium chitinilyticum]|uniref:histidine kinase n=1 Tax=Alkalihalobacterium chitinilyticum TaxID=2980103 RepID=A0ABT5VDA1_9BACI|nr:ATP-binding protein [Alkalihalobacterium chitinilyticum]MDE5413425.1 histidine kinase [Alkalihalobacterium chitinilyticum]
MKLEWFKQVVDDLSEGVVIINKDRVIHYHNQLAKEMTGWELGDVVPYCSYCKMREVAPGEERCILAHEDPLPSFQAHMPTYKGKKETSFEMSTTKIPLEGMEFMVLILRNPKWTSEKERLKIKKLLIRDTIATQEKERKAIAMELHDDISQGVYSAFLGLQGVKHHITDENYQSHFRKIEGTLEKTLDNIQRLTKQLRPQAIDQFGLKATLKSAVEDWKKFYKVNFTLSYQIHEYQLSKEVELQLFRLIQEAVTNAVRHGKAKEIMIKFTESEDQIMFQIIDDGQGFDVGQTKFKGLGLYHMKERMAMINGEVNWDSKIGGPTKVEGYVDMNNKGC